MGAESSRFVDANPASQAQLDSTRAHLIPQRVLSQAATNTNPLGF
jgi:hypothetical protein